MADASVKVVHGASIAHITSGTSMAATSINVASTATALTSTNLSSYPRCDLKFTYISTTTTSSTAMNVPIYRRDENVGGITDADDAAPAALNSNKYVGSFNLPATTSGTHICTALNIALPGGSAGCEFFLQNNLTNTIAAGWSLTVIPKTDVGATS